MWKTLFYAGSDHYSALYRRARVHSNNAKLYRFKIDNSRLYEKFFTCSRVVSNKLDKSFADKIEKVLCLEECVSVYIFRIQKGLASVISSNNTERNCQA